jgi:hypothetical protein
MPSGFLRGIGLHEIERGGVHAIAQSGRRRTILEDVAEV